MGKEAKPLVWEEAKERAFWLPLKKGFGISKMTQCSALPRQYSAKGNIWTWLDKQKHFLKPNLTRCKLPFVAAWRCSRYDAGCCTFSASLVGTLVQFHMWRKLKPIRYYMANFIDHQPSTSWNRIIQSQSCTKEVNNNFHWCLQKCVNNYSMNLCFTKE